MGGGEGGRPRGLILSPRITAPPPHCHCMPHNNTAMHLQRWGGSSSSESLARGCLGADPHPAGTHIMGGCRNPPPSPFTGTFDPQSPAFGVGGGRGRTDLCPPQRRGLGDAFAAWPEGWEQLPCSNNCPPPAAPIAPHPTQLTPSASRSPRIQQTPTQLRPPSPSCPSPPTPVSNCPL